MNKIYKAPDRKMRFSAIAVCLLLTVMLAIGGTLAYIFTQSEAVVNTFDPVTVDNEITEELEDNVKKNVRIKNTGEIDAFIRAKVVITWQNEAGNVYPVAPASSDYTSSWNVSDTVKENVWVLGADGFYYYTSAVAAEASTAYLIISITPTAACPDENYTLHVEILSQAIQSTPDTVVEKMWSNSLVTLDANNGVLTVTDK